jgi:hypothetical protein
VVELTASQEFLAFQDCREKMVHLALKATWDHKVVMAVKAIKELKARQEVTAICILTGNNAHGLEKIAKTTD